MGEQNKISSRPIFRRDVSWDPFPNWTQPSRIFAQDFGLPPFLDSGDLDWIEWSKRRLASFSWPGYTQSPLLPPFGGQCPPALNQKGQRQRASGVSEIQTGQDSWKINLDVNHFSPEEITITTKEGYLQISGTLRMLLWLSYFWDVTEKKVYLSLSYFHDWKEIMKKSKTSTDLFPGASPGNTSKSLWESESSR